MNESSSPQARPSATAAMKWTVSSLMHAVADALAARFGVVTVTGELSALTRAGSGHWYFSLKDEAATARCVMFRGKNSLVDFTPREGQLVELRAQVAVYEPRGDLQLVVESMRPAGMGALYEQFLVMKAKLEAEGLFDASRKRGITPLPRVVGIITSRNAAALRDVLTALQRRAPHVRVFVYPAVVQGAQAPQEIVDALRLANARAMSDGLDTLLLVRGGGSLEDLMAFNDERVARAIAASALPIISGVGHETDMTIADFVADLRAATPTAAAELAATPRQDWLDELDTSAAGLSQRVERLLSRQAQRLDAAELSLAAMKQVAQKENARLMQSAAKLQARVHARIRSEWHTLDRYAWKSADIAGKLTNAHSSIRLIAHRLQAAMNAQLTAHTQRLSAHERTTQVLSPQRTLERGYSVLLAQPRKDETAHAVRSVKELQALDKVRAVLADGETEIHISRQGQLL